MHAALSRLTDDAASPSGLSNGELAEAVDVATNVGFVSWPDWREYERRRFEEFKKQSGPTGISC